MRTFARLSGRLVGRGDRESMPYRRYLFEDLKATGRSFENRRILEIGPKDGQDTERLRELAPSELVLIELPEKEDLVRPWLSRVPDSVEVRYDNILYMDDLESLGQFDLVWCTGVLYHNAEQLRLLARLRQLLCEGGILVLESATLRGSRAARRGKFVQVHFPETYRGTGTVTHLPSAGAVRAWLEMVGFGNIKDSSCHRRQEPRLGKVRYACIAERVPDAQSYYGGEYAFGLSR